MSYIRAMVSEILKCDSLHIVKFKNNTDILTMMSLDLNNNIIVGTKVNLIIKPTHIVLAKRVEGNLSFSNKLSCNIKSINNGELLSSIQLNYNNIILESIITLETSITMDLKVGDKITAFIQASELSIGEII